MDKNFLKCHEVQLLREMWFGNFHPGILFKRKWFHLPQIKLLFPSLSLNTTKVFLSAQSWVLLLLKNAYNTYCLSSKFDMQCI